MDFEIATAVSPEYLDVMQLCLPSWIRNSGATMIRVYPMPADRESGTAAAHWHRQVTRRCRLMRDAVLKAVASYRRLLFLDIDCFVLSELSQGFAAERPIAVARWPDINMGVLFFDCRQTFPWTGFFHVLLRGIEERCQALIESPPKKFRMGDQEIWQEMLARHETQVDKLDANVWNFCPHEKQWQDQVRQHKDTIKIIHIKTRHHHLQAPVLDYIRREFPDVF